MKKTIIIEVEENVYDLISKSYMLFYDWCMNHYDEAPTKDEYIETLLTFTLFEVDWR